MCNVDEEIEIVMTVMPVQITYGQKRPSDLAFEEFQRALFG